MSKVQKEIESLCKASTQDYCNIKTVELSAYLPGRNIRQVYNKTLASWINHQ